MAGRIVSYGMEDWTRLEGEALEGVSGIELSDSRNFGIHFYNGSLCTGGYVGVGRLYGRNGRPLVTGGREHVAVIRPRLAADPWGMLEKVMTDAEYDSYCAEMERNGKYLFRIYYDQPVIRLPADRECGDDILYALSFINQCYSLCQRGLKKRMLGREENLNAKIRGKVDIRQNIRVNTFRGRNDRFCCRYMDFTADTWENRILKAALLRCEKMLIRRFALQSGIMKRLAYCKHLFRSVGDTTVGERDFKRANATGLYLYYKPLLQQAKGILRRNYHAGAAGEERDAAPCVYLIPYMINMETVFEFYVRTLVRESLNPERFVLEKYGERIFTRRGGEDPERVRQGAHLSPFVIPDLVIRDRHTGKPALVMDAKYKPPGRPDREDTHQLLSYVLLTGAPFCGFAFPGRRTPDGDRGGDPFSELNSPLGPFRYCEWFLGEEPDLPWFGRLPEREEKRES